MKKIMMAAMAVCVMAGMAVAEVKITKVDKVSPTDEMFMDMAVTAANNNLKEGQLPCGAVVILNGAAPRTAGRSTATLTAEEDAINKSRRKSLKNAVIYTVNEPTTDAYNAICRSGADAVYFCNPREAVISKGVYPASAYDDARIDTTYTPVKMGCIEISEGKAVLNKYVK
ncbi:MAG: hypothetical protein K1V84_11570 [Muribaculaceae bacterium]